MPSTKTACRSCAVPRWKTDFMAKACKDLEMQNITWPCLFCKFDANISKICEDVNEIKIILDKLKEDNEQTKTNSITTFENKINDFDKKITELSEGLSELAKNDSEPIITIERDNRQANDFINPKTVKPVCQTKTFEINLANRFTPLEDINSNSNNKIIISPKSKPVILIGDSLTRKMDLEFVERKMIDHTRICLPGAKTSDFCQKIKFSKSLNLTKNQILRKNETESFVVNQSNIVALHCGSNDSYNKNEANEKAVLKQRSILEKLKGNSCIPVVIAAFPRPSAALELVEKTRDFNSKLREMCHAENFAFFDYWNDFRDPNLFEKDGVHLNPWGIARYGRLFDNSIKNFRNKEIVF